MPAGLHDMEVVDVVHTIASISSNSSVEEAVAVPGVRAGDFVFCAKSNLDAGLIVGSSRVSKTDEVKIQLVNATAGAVSPTAETLSFFVFRPFGHRSSAR